MRLNARDMKAIAQVLYSRKHSTAGLAVNKSRLEELSGAFATLADQAEANGWTYDIDVEAATNDARASR